MENELDVLIRKLNAIHELTKSMVEGLASNTEVMILNEYTESAKGMLMSMNLNDELDELDSIISHIISYVNGDSDGLLAVENCRSLIDSLKETNNG